jgi:hypothetical protein
VDADPTESAYESAVRLAVPTDRVAADTVEGEAVIINLETGAYYTTEGPGCDAWQLLAAGLSLGEVVTALGERYVAADGDIERYVQRMVATVLGEQLMLLADPSDAPHVDASPQLSAADTPVPFEPADFVSFRDMKGLLLLDPVHDVGPEGWPYAADGG